MIAIIDYGMGNLMSVEKALLALGFQSVITNNPKEIEKAAMLILPGVGSFGSAMNNLKKLNLIEPIKSFIRSGRPYLGICLGLQLLFEESTEDGKHKGFGILKGKVIKFKFSKEERLSITHMGWNTIEIKKENTFLNNKPMFYFVHSYFVEPTDTNIILTTTNYGIEFTSSILQDNIFATQFHPEKSGQSGLNILKSFIEQN